MNGRMKRLFEKKLSAKKIEKWMKHHTIQDLRDVGSENYVEEDASKVLTLIDDLDDLGCDIRTHDSNEEIANFDAVDKKISLEA